MKNVIITLTKGDKRIAYIAPRKIEKSQELHIKQKRLRFKAFLFNYFLVTIYNPGMDFTLAIKEGWNVEENKTI